MLRLAVMCGIALSNDDADNNEPKLPEDKNQRWKLLRAVNAGYRDFVMAKHDWSWLRPVVTTTFATTADSFNVGKDTARKLMVGHVASGFVEQPVCTTGDSAAGFRMQVVSAAEIEARHAADPTRTGMPTHVAIVSVPGVELSDQVRVAMVVFPKPDRTYKVVAALKLAPRFEFEDPGEALLCPPEYADVLLYAAARKLQLEAPNAIGPSFEAMDSEYRRLLDAAKESDSRMMPVNIGSLVHVHDCGNDPFIPYLGNSVPRVMLPGGGYAT